MSETNSTHKHKEPSITLQIKTMNSSHYDVVTYPNSNIASFQAQIQQKTGVPIAAQRLLYKGMLLQPIRNLSDYQINSGSVIQLIANRIPSQVSSPSSYRPSEMIKLQKCNEQNTKYKKHRYLQQRINGFGLNIKQSLQTLNQAKHTLDELLLTINKNHDSINNPFKTNKIKREVGQWVDILEGCGQWMEGQIIKRNGSYLLVHYNNCPEGWDEWIVENSQRIMPFRSQTVQSQQSQYLSPYPGNKCLISNKQNTNFQSSIESLMASMSPTLENISSLLKQLNLDEKEEEQSLKNVSHISIHHVEAPKSESQKKQELYETPNKQQPVQKQIPIDNISNKCEDDISYKGDGDDGDISAKSFKSKRSQGLVNTSSMKSLMIDETRRKQHNKIFFDYTQAQSVRSVKNKNKYHMNYYENQENILEEEDSQYYDQQEDFYVKKKKNLQRKLRASQLAPLCDRLGRFLIDLAPHLAMMGYTQQYTNSHFNENLSTFTNEGSLESKLANLNRMIPEEEESKSSSHHKEGTYWNFQIPVMLTPAEIIKLNKYLEQQSNHI